MTSLGSVTIALFSEPAPVYMRIRREIATRCRLVPDSLILVLWERAASSCTPFNLIIVGKMIKLKAVMIKLNHFLSQLFCRPFF